MNSKIQFDEPKSNSTFLKILHLNKSTEFGGNYTSTEFDGNYSETTGDYYYYYYFDRPYQMVTKKWQVPIFAYLYSGISLLTILVNIMVIYVFAKKKMRSQTTFLLSSLACSNSAICLAVAVYHIYFHLLEHYRDPVEYTWCILKRVLHIMEEMARSSSNWITALLGIQRFVCICYPFRARSLCSIKASIMAVLVSVIVGIVVYIYEAVSVEIVPFSIKNGSAFLYEGCVLGTRYGVTQTSVMVSYIISGFVARFLPCIVLFITTILLARKLQRRNRGIAADLHDRNRSSAQMKRLNGLVFIILTIFLVSELQDTIAFCIYAYELATDRIREVLTADEDDHWDTWGNLLSLFSYHCNFWIFFLMSSQFRSAFYDTCSSVRKRQFASSTRTTMISSNFITETDSFKPLQRPKK